MERRYLIVPGIHSSRIHIIDTKPDPRKPTIVKVIEAETLTARTGYARRTRSIAVPTESNERAGCPDGDGPGGMFMMDQDSFDVLGKWEIDRGPQNLAYDFWWHLGHDTMITSEWGTPNMVQQRRQSGDSADRRLRPQLHVWDLRQAPPSAGARSRRGTADGARAASGARSHQSVRLSRRRRVAEGSVGVDLALASRQRQWGIKKMIEIPAEPADPRLLPPLLKGFKAVPPLGHRHQSLARRPVSVRLVLGHRRVPAVRRLRSVQAEADGSVHIGGIVRQRRPSEAIPKTPLNGGPQMVEVSRDGRRVYFTNSLYVPWDEQFYPDGIRGWMVKIDAKPEGGIDFDPEFFLDFGEQRPHQVRLEGGDASSDSYCYA